MSAAASPAERRLDACLDALPEPRYVATAHARRFHVSAQRADGGTVTWQRQGGSSAQHAQEAMDHAGLGGVVRVLELTEPQP